MFGFFFFISQMFEKYLNYTPLQTGCAFLSLTIINFLVALMQPKLSKKFSNNSLILVGLFFILGGIFMLARLSGNVSYLNNLAFPLFLLGIGQGLAFGPLTSAGTNGVDKENAGIAAGMVNTVHQFGGAIGIALMVYVSKGDKTNSLYQFTTGMKAGTIMISLAILCSLIVMFKSKKII